MGMGLFGDILDSAINYGIIKLGETSRVARIVLDVAAYSNFSMDDLDADIDNE